SFQQWAMRLQTAAQSSAWQSALDYWQLIQPSSPLPHDFPQGSNTVADLEITSVALNTTETEALLQTVPTAYQTQINDALLTALLLAFADWTGDRTLLLELEGHGREADLSELGPQGTLDLSRTIGWFTTLFPVWLNLESNQIGAALKGIKEQLRAIPQRGLSYGVLRYLANAPLPHLQAQVRFNYLGQIDHALHPPFAIAPETIGPTRSSSGQRHVLLEINALIVSGELRVHWGYSRAIHHPTTIATLAEGFIGYLRNLIQHCQSPDAGGYTPSDFPLMDISQTELDNLLTEL
ncbi:MAG: non-ribosomal peptide synthetase, partial [Synechococcales cyanobacterium M58_A2018_015]|nr:non-ribosomal peptide synthetase [Synechococcales cyanobacterium M58_A2018_015]